MLTYSCVIKCDQVVANSEILYPHVSNSLSEMC